MGFFKKYFEQTSYDYSSFYMMLFIFFFSVFIIYLFITLKINKNKIEKIKNLPLEN